MESGTVRFCMVIIILGPRQGVQNVLKGSALNGGGDARKHRMIIFSQNSLIILFTFCTKFENGFQKFISNRYRLLGKAVFCVCARFPPMRLCVCVRVCVCVCVCVFVCA